MAKQVRLGHIRLEPSGMSGAFHRGMTWSGWVEIDMRGVATITCPNASCAKVFEVHVRSDAELRALRNERGSRPGIIEWLAAKKKVLPYTLTARPGGSTAFHEAQVSS